MRCIVATQPDRSVIVVHPSQDVMGFLTCGGLPAGYLGRVIDEDWEVDKFVRGGTRESIARRWIRSLIAGGLTDAEAYEVMADKDVPQDCSGVDVIDTLPPRWFRDAWRRSLNGGPIEVDMPAARMIHAKNLINQRKRIITKIEEQTELDKMTGQECRLLTCVERLRGIDLSNVICNAQTPEALQQVQWPQELMGVT